MPAELTRPARYKCDSVLESMRHLRASVGGRGQRGGEPHLSERIRAVRAQTKGSKIRYTLKTRMCRKSLFSIDASGCPPRHAQTKFEGFLEGHAGFLAFFFFNP